MTKEQEAYEKQVGKLISNLKAKNPKLNDHGLRKLAVKQLFEEK